MKYFIKEATTDAENVAAVASSAAGYKFLRSSNKGGYLTGRESLYHFTPRGNVSLIMDKGVLGHTRELANGSDGMTGRKLDHIPDKALKGKTYAFKSKSKALLQKHTRGIYLGQDGTLIKIKAPVGAYKEVANPELLGSKKKFIEYIIRVSVPEKEKLSNVLGKKGADIILKNTASKSYKTLGPKVTKTIQGDIKPEHIKGSKKYIKHTFKEFKNFVKNNPGKFSKGLGKATTGTVLLAGGALLASGALTKNKQEEIIK